ncbi:hypothetical protein ACNTMW_01730 [Planosporangium sp. 12N6]|uniref:hypothetical protein n=1 Tax=Planosporangium spinosum TaxID=3402278 RepID=UPI003CEE32C2
MGTQPVTRTGDDLSAADARLRNAIACELHAQLAMRGETIELADVPEVAYAVAVQLRHAFHVEWAPRWADEPADDGSWSLDAARWRPDVHDHGDVAGR